MRYEGQNATAGYITFNGIITNGYFIWLDYSGRSGKKECLAEASNAIANKVCVSMGGKILRAKFCPLSTVTQRSYYELPTDFN
jgi:hypothetical protein